MSRLDELRSLYEQARSSVDVVDADKRASLIREARFLLAEIDELEASLPAEGPRNPLDELVARRERRSA